MEETLKAKIRNLLSPSYNLASMIKKETNKISKDNLSIVIYPEIANIFKSEAEIAYNSIEEILKLLDNDK